jgi:hypothetical protein
MYPQSLPKNTALLAFRGPGWEAGCPGAHVSTHWAVYAVGWGWDSREPPPSGSCPQQGVGAMLRGPE